MKNLLKIAAIILTILPLFSCNKEKTNPEPEPTDSVTTLPVISKTIENLYSGTLTAEHFVFFSFETGDTIPAVDSNSKKWDIAFKRAVIRINSGISGPGNAGVNISSSDYGAVLVAPESGYVIDGDGPNDKLGLGYPDGLAFNNWFDYADSKVIPKDKTYIIRTANNKYAKFKISSYYHTTTNASAYYTFTYTYQPGGSKVLE